MINRTIIENIKELYFEKLEEDCVDFIEYEEADQGYTFSHIKEEYLDMPLEDMVDYLFDLSTWQGQWALLNAKGTN